MIAVHLGKGLRHAFSGRNLPSHDLHRIAVPRRTAFGLRVPDAAHVDTRLERTAHSLTELGRCPSPIRPMMIGSHEPQRRSAEIKVKPKQPFSLGPRLPD